MAHDLPQDQPTAGLRISAALTIPESLLEFTFSRSGGPGGQNVNKLATRAQLRVPLAAVQLLMLPGAAQRLAHLAGNRLTDAGDLLLVSEESRSQRMNRQTCLDHLRDLLLHALTPPRPRGPTRPSRGAKVRRLEHKRQHGQIKRRRREGRGMGMGD